MIALGRLYATVVFILLLVALAVCIPVLGRIVRDGLERHRERQVRKGNRETEDEEDDREPPAKRAAETTAAVRCPQCGAENDPAFAYCRRCATALRAG